MSWLRREGLLNGAARPRTSLSKPEPPVARKKPEAWRRPVAATFVYVDERGQALFRVIKFADGDPRFMQQRPDGCGKWIWGLGDARRVLYRLPEVLGAVSAGRSVYVVEGEKDVETLHALGLVATTNPMGANKWSPEYSESLRGADVILLGDNDEPGRRHVKHIADELRGKAKRVRALDLANAWPGCPDKGDISDWVAAGGDAEKLRSLVEVLPDWDSSVVSVVSAAPAAWPQIDEAAFHGLAGEVVKTIEPHTEADRVAILVQFLALAGNVIGRTAYYQVEGDRHHTNLFAVLVGDSSKARKGTSLGRVRSIVKEVDQSWADDRLKGGLSSGEGLINEVRDERREWNKKEDREEVADPGVTDKRLMVVEPEFAGVLENAGRHGNTLSQLIRRAWDGDKLATITKNSPLCATGAHISIIGHITIAELRAQLTRTDAANGFANRFLFPLVRRSKQLPFGGELLDDAEISTLAKRLRERVESARTVGRVTMTANARMRWEAVYAALSAPQHGLLGAVVARGEAQVVRLALVYALLDGADQIDAPHLDAALAVWDYCESSAAFIFGNLLGDPVADEIGRALRQAGPQGMTRTAIRNLFGRNRAGDRISAALALLATQGRARTELRRTNGHPAEIWISTGG